MKNYDFMNPKQEINTELYMVNEADNIKEFDHTKIYRSPAFQEAMKSFDITDTMTRAVLLSVNEADQNAVMTSLANKLYQHIVDKVDDIDFGTIPLSKGDITKIDNYDKLTDCINIIAEILQQYHQSTESIEIVATALQNIIDRTDMFTKAYKLNIEMPIIIYNTMALSIVSSVSYMISACIEFIKSGDEGFQIALDKAALSKTMNNVLFKDLAKFNKICGSGEFDKAMNYVINQNTKNLTGWDMYSVGSVAMVLGLLLLIIPLIRELIFFFYYSRCKVADYFEAQASLLTMNAYNIENNLTRGDKDKKQIASKQKKIAEKFKKIAEAIKIKNKTGEVKSQNDIKKLDSKKYKQDEVLDSIPDSSNSVLF